MILLAIDPGREKCGYAVVSLDVSEASHLRSIQKGIIPPVDLGDLYALWNSWHPGLEVIIGAGTGSAQVQEILAQAGATWELVDERFTTQRARVRYFIEHPPRGWRRLIPCGLLTPPCPVDDFAALLLAEDWSGRERVE